MRVVQNSQMQIGEVDISQIKFDPKSRDDIPKILKGLQHLYVNLPLREKIFALLEAEISPKVDKRNGRPGMALWTIFVCGVPGPSRTLQTCRALPARGANRRLDQPAQEEGDHPSKTINPCSLNSCIKVSQTH